MLGVKREVMVDPRRSMRRPWKLGVRRQHCSLFVTEWGVLRRKFWQESRFIRSYHTQRCRSFSERVGPRIVWLESQSGKQSSRSKRSREITTELVTVRNQTKKTLTEYRQSMTACGYCCCYACGYCCYCSKTNHISIKRAEYQNVLLQLVGLHHKICRTPNLYR